MAATAKPQDQRRILRPTSSFLILPGLLLLLFAPAASAFQESDQQGDYGGGYGVGGYGGGGGGFGSGGGSGGGGGGGGGGYSSDGGDSFDYLHNYTDCSPGENRTGLAQVKQYMHQFGYLPVPSDNSAYNDFFDGDFEDAVKAYQTFFNLPVTGTLDNATVELMIQPRCGVADMQVNGSTSPGRNLYTYFSGNPSWPKERLSLTYAFAATTASSPPMPMPVLRKVFGRAFARWAEVTKLTFTEVGPDSTPDITIGFFNRDHGDGEPFDGPLGTLAHAFSPTDGRFHLDASEIWTAVEQDAAAPTLGTTAKAIDLESVAVHEIGHLLGLGHSVADGAIMYPTIRAQSRRVNLVQDDIAGIQKLYGNNPMFNGTSNFGDGNNNINEGVRGRTTSGAAVMPPAKVFALVPAAVAMLLVAVI